jgi:predicted nuclease of predicted toxin-antitoxin system
VKFLLDHGVSDNVTPLLHQLGHEVRLLREVLHRATSDADIFEYALRENWMLITCNRDDFLELARRTPHNGLIILIREKITCRGAAALLRLLEQAGENGLAGNINFA